MARRKKKAVKKTSHRKSRKKEPLMIHQVAAKKVNDAVMRPGRPFTLRDHLMMAHTEKMLTKEEHSIYAFMKAGLLFILVGLIVIIVFRNIIYELLGWAAIVIGFLELLESYHRMDRWKKEMLRIKRGG